MKTSQRNRRKFERIDKEAQIQFEFTYDAQTKVKYQVADQTDHKNLVKKFSATSKNISANGLCFTSGKKLKKGQNLNLELYLPKIKEPIHMSGQVRWSDRSQSEKIFHTGVKLITVEGYNVAQSVHFDKDYHVYWSKVLDSVFGTFRKRIQQLKLKIAR